MTGSSVDIEEILVKAEAAGASDVHLTVGLPPMMRVDGSLVPMPYPELAAQDTVEAANHIMGGEQLEKLERQGECDLAYAIPGRSRCRVNAFRQRESVALALRLVAAQVPSPERLGLPESVVGLYQKKRGLILVTGPTGSGKSTTLAAIIDKVYQYRDAHIITLEDPIEYYHPHKRSMVNQREIGVDTGSYANALRAALREDPDVILVGEMRDFETISVAITAAETGHLVLSTLHTIGAASTVDRIIDVFPPHQQQQIRVQLSNVLESIISQQLIPGIGGGRVAAFEILHANGAIRNLIREGKTHQIANVMQTNRKLGMMSMDDAIAQLAREGRIARQTAVSFAVDPENMERSI